MRTDGSAQGTMVPSFMVMVPIPICTHENLLTIDYNE